MAFRTSGLRSIPLTLGTHKLENSMRILWSAQTETPVFLFATRETAERLPSSSLTPWLGRSPCRWRPSRPRQTGPSSRWLQRAWRWGWPCEAASRRWIRVCVFPAWAWGPPAYNTFHCNRKEGGVTACVSVLVINHAGQDMAELKYVKAVILFYLTTLSYTVFSRCILWWGCWEQLAAPHQRRYLQLSNKSQWGHLTSTVWIVPPGRTYPGLQSPPCSSNTRSTRGGTCALRPPGNPNADRLTFKPFTPADRLGPEAAVWLCCALRLRDARPAVASHCVTATTPALPAHCLESAVMSPVSSGLEPLVSLIQSVKPDPAHGLLRARPLINPWRPSRFLHTKLISIRISFCFSHARWHHVSPTALQQKVKLGTSQKKRQR